MLNRLTRIVALVAALGYASVAYGQATTAYPTEGPFNQIGELSSWAHDQCVAPSCMREALQLIRDVHVAIRRMNDFNKIPTVAKRDLIQSTGNALGDRIDQWAERYKINVVRVSTSLAK